MTVYTRITLTIALALPLLLAGLVLGLLGLAASESGTAWLAGIARDRLAGQVDWRDLQGALLDGVQLTGFEFDQPGVSLTASSAALAWRPGALLHGELAITALTLEEATLTLDQDTGDQETGDEDTGDDDPSAPLQPGSLRPPLDITLRGVELRDVRLLQAGEAEQQIDRASLDMAIRGDEIDLRSLELHLPEGRLALRGSAALRQAMPIALELDGDWQLPLSATPAGADAEPRLRARLALDGSVEWGRVMAIGVRYRLALDGLDTVAADTPAALAAHGRLQARQEGTRVELTELGLALDDTALALELSGTIEQPPAQAPKAALLLTWQGAQWPLLAARPEISITRGSLRLTGGPEDYELALETALAGTQVPAGDWQAVARGDRQGMHIDSLRGELLGGSLVVSGPIAWSPAPSWDLQIKGRDLDPGSVIAELAGPLHTVLATTGRIDAQGDAGAVLSLDSLEARVLDTPVSLTGTARLASDTLHLDDVQLASGDNRLNARGAVSMQQLDVDWRLLLTDPGLFLPGAAGRVEGGGRIEGSPDAPAVRAELRGSGLALDTLTVDSVELKLTAGLEDDAPLALQLTAAGMRDADSTLIERLTLDGQGVIAAHAVTLAIDAPEARLLTSARGGWSQDTMAWSGALTELDVRAGPLGDWALDTSVPLSLATDQARLGQACLLQAAQEGRLCVAGNWAAAGAAALDLELDSLPIGAFSPSITGQLSGQLAGTLSPEGRLAARGSARLSPGQLHLPEGLDQTSLDHGGGGANLTIDRDGLLATLDLDAPEGGTLSARLALPALDSLPLAPRQPVAGTLRAALPELSFLSALVDDIARSTGRLGVDLDVTGTLDQPLLAGELSLADGAVSLPVAGLELDDIQLRATSEIARPGVLMLSGGLESGPGRADLSGTLDFAGGVSRVLLRGDRLEVFDTRDARVLLSPDLEALWERDTLTLRGQVTVPEAAITPRLRLSAATAEDPAAGESRGAVILPSRDVVILGGNPVTTATGQVDAEAPFRIDAAVDLRLGDAVRVNAAGLISRITGGLRFSLDPEQRELLPHARGVVSLEDGTFRSFGQDLDIETGQLVFGNVPVTEPEVYLRAVRWIDNDPDVTAAGVVVTGSVTEPELELFSRPQLETTAIQSYLLTGTASGGGAGVLSIGTYITKRIYVGYGYNLLEETSEFDALFTVTPRYGLGADVGEADSNFNLTFTHER